MPYVAIKTNREIEPAARDDLLTATSARVAEELGKPEKFVMVCLESGCAMRFGGSDAPLAYLEFKSIGLPETRTAELSAVLAELMDTHLGIPKERVYVEFADAQRHMWGYNGATF